MFLFTYLNICNECFYSHSYKYVNYELHFIELFTANGCFYSHVLSKWIMSHQQNILEQIHEMVSGRAWGMVERPDCWSDAVYTTLHLPRNKTYIIDQMSYMGMHIQYILPYKGMRGHYMIPYMGMFAGTSGSVRELCEQPPGVPGRPPGVHWLAGNDQREARHVFWCDGRSTRCAESTRSTGGRNASLCSNVAQHVLRNDLRNFCDEFLIERDGLLISI